MKYKDIYFGYEIEDANNYKKLSGIIKSSFIMGFNSITKIVSYHPIKGIISEKLSIIDNLYEMIFFDRLKLEKFASKEGYQFNMRKNGDCEIWNSGSYLLTPGISLIVKSNHFIQTEIGIPHGSYGILINIDEDKFIVHTGFNYPENRMQLDYIKKEINKQRGGIKHGKASSQY